MPTQTWSFNSGYNGWTFIDNSTPNASVTRSHVSGAIRNTAFMAAAGVDRTAEGDHFSPTELNTTIVNGDTISLDYGAPSDGLITRIYVRAFYTDETFEETTVLNKVAGTLTLTMTQSKTLDYINVELLDGLSAGFPGSRGPYTRDWLEVRLTTASAIEATAGKLRTPQNFIEEQGAGAAGGAGGGSGGNIASISADGLYVYIASFNNLGFPTLIKILAALSSDGSVVFEPGAGGRIGVKTAEFEADTLFVAGQFDGTNTVEKSDDAGAAFSSIDDGTFGAIRTFQVGPGDDDRILLFDGDNGDIIESLDGGETWTTINASVTQLVNSIARFDVSPEESVFGNEGDATDSINYSPNSGANLEDYQTGVYPNADATKVIAN